VLFAGAVYILFIYINNTINYVIITCVGNLNLFKLFKNLLGRDSSVGIATAYGLDGSGIESRWGRDFPRPSKPALRPTQPLVQWEPGLSRG
jgi:hypothetical protein